MLRTTLLSLVAVVGGSLVSSPAGAECTGTLGGAVKLTFRCTVDVRANKKGDETYFAITVPKLPDSLLALAPALANIKGKPEKRSYDLKSLDEASSSVVTKDGKSFLAKTGAGSLKITLSSVQPGERRRFTVSGTASAVAKNLNGPGEVKVEVKF